MEPMVRSNICLNAHPEGCRQSVLNQIAYTKEQKAKYSTVPGTHRPVKNVLVLGCSNGYGLASRITAAFAYDAATIGVSFEKPGSEKKYGTPGWYNNMAFDQEAAKAGLYTCTIDGDAYSNEIKATLIGKAKEAGMTFDLVVYSLASPVRTDPDTKIMHKSVIKPIGCDFSGKTFDPMTGEMKEITAQAATEEEIAHTVKVMGGEDWERWMKQLSAAGVLSEGCMTVAYSYIGPEVSQAIYRRGTIGMAKLDLEQKARTITALLSDLKGFAYVSVNKGLVTRASAVIPIIPLYLSVLFKVMKEKGTHEGCIEQINRLFAERLYIKSADGNAPVPVDEENRIRIDDWEMDSSVQAEVDRIMPQVTAENIATLGDLTGYRHDFLATSGFDIAGVDYTKEIERFDVL
ncbi:MAG: trans-2-enoyl-CoA reductase family protein [Treponemataceae bacterium]|nr:trans-2-enoyl-CoA reductase family protein [Treponemataceae bacterium]